MFIFRTARSFAREGDKARDCRDWPAARDAYAEAVRRDPTREGVWVQYGHALKESGQREAAEGAYRRALEINPRNADTHLQLGHLLKLLGRPEEAIAAYSASVELDPKGPYAAAELAALLAARAASAAAAPRPAAHPAAGAEAARPELLTRDVLLALEAGDLDRALALLRRLEEAPPAPPPNSEEATLGELIALTGRRLARDHRDAALQAAMRLLKARRFALRRPELIAEHGPAAETLPQALRFIAIGTTGLCNASCIHCPTGKPETDHVPRTPMPMPLFEKILRQLAQFDMTVTTNINFGLFGDALVDPLIVPRFRKARELLPEVTLVVNTNGAAYTRAKHKPLADIATLVALHIESLVPETYNTLMQPLRLERVLPKVEQILEDFPGRVYVSVPASTMNRAELPAIRKWFMDRGAMSVSYDFISSRCSEDTTLFRQLAFQPVRGRCGPELMDELIVDSDGMVLMCCQDFQRIEPIGDLSRQPLLEVMIGPERLKVREQFAQGRHAERLSCSRCWFDTPMSQA